MIFGILGGNEPLGLSNFTYKEAPFVNGISGFLGVLLVAGFSFGGTEVVAVTAGESENPKESMKKLSEVINKYSKFAAYKMNITKFDCVSIH